MPAQPPNLADLAFNALAEALPQHYAEVGALSCVPTSEAQLLLQLVGESLSSHEAGAVAPPIEVLRTFYGGSLERLKQLGAGDAWLSEAMGLGGLRRLSRLSLSLSRLSAYGLGHIACALPSLVELRLSRCKGMTAAGLAEVGRLSQLQTLGITECELVLREASEMVPLERLRRLHTLDLGGNKVEPTAAVGLCELLRSRDAGEGGGGGGEDGGGEGVGEGGGGVGAPLRVLRLWGSPADDAVAAAASALPGLRALELGWSRCAGSGLQALLRAEFARVLTRSGPVSGQRGRRGPADGGSGARGGATRAVPRTLRAGHTPRPRPPSASLASSRPPSTSLDLLCNHLPPTS